MRFTLKEHVYRALEDPTTPPGRIVNGVLAWLILLNVLSVMLRTVPTLSPRLNEILYSFEVGSILAFTVEYVLRLWVATLNPAYEGRPFWGRLRYAVTPYALVDLVAILPFYLPMIARVDLVMLRVLRIVRMLRLVKLARYSEAIRIIGAVVERKRGELLVIAFFVAVFLVLAAGMLYYLEHDAQPEAFPSIPAALWWGVGSLTPVGNAGVHPITPWGKVVGAIFAILGIGLIALPAGVLATGFIEQLNQRPGDGKAGHCPHCGKEIP